MTPTGGMRVGRAADLPRRRLELEPERRLRDEVRGVWPDDVDAQRVVGLDVRDDLGEALVLAADECLGDRLERDLADLELVAGGGRLRLGQPDRGDLRPAVRRSGLGRVVHVMDVRVAGDRMRGDRPSCAAVWASHNPPIASPMA